MINHEFVGILIFGDSFRVRAVLRILVRFFGNHLCFLAFVNFLVFQLEYYLEISFGFSEILFRFSTILMINSAPYWLWIFCGTLFLVAADSLASSQDSL